MKLVLLLITKTIIGVLGFTLSAYRFREGKKTKMVNLGLTWLVHSVAHELAASPEATSRLLSSAERCFARSDEGGAGEGRRLHEGASLLLVEALSLALRILL